MTARIYRTDRGLPRRAGVGFKPQHMAEIIRRDADIGFFEVHAEIYMGAGGLPHAQLCASRERYALSIHGVGLSIGAAQPLDRAHLRRLRTLSDQYQPQMFSEHLAWSSHGDVFLRRCHINRLRGSEANSADRDQAATPAMAFHCAMASKR
jgi:hypothetical protein